MSVLLCEVGWTERLAVVVEVDGIEKEEEEKFEDALFIILGVVEEEKMLEGIPVDGVLDLFIEEENVSIKPGLQLETDLFGVGLKILVFLFTLLLDTGKLDCLQVQ